MATRRRAGLAIADLVNVHGTLAVGQARQSQFDRDFLDAFRRDLLDQGGRALDHRVGAALHVGNGTHTVCGRQ